MKTSTTRRTILAGLAAAPGAGLLTIAAALPGADPVLVTLAEYRGARAAMNAAFAASSAMLAANRDDETVRAAEDAEEEPFQRLLAAEDAVLEARPTTREGAFRLLAHVAGRLESDALGDRELALAPDAIRGAVTVLEREGRA